MRHARATKRLIMFSKLCNFLIFSLSHCLHKLRKVSKFDFYFSFKLFFYLIFRVNLKLSRDVEHIISRSNISTFFDKLQLLFYFYMDCDLGDSKLLANGPALAHFAYNLLVGFRLHVD